jgi:hypothetical protein
LGKASGKSMGLDCIVKYKNSESNQYTEELPIPIAKLFGGLNLIGMGGMELSNPQFIMFRGKAYNNVVQKISGASLYSDLEPELLRQIYLKFNKFNESNQEKFNELNQVYRSHGYLIDEWTDLFTNQYIPSPSEIAQLEQFFKICAENNLMLYASY